jgi:hypothetical protein
MSHMAPGEGPQFHDPIPDIPYEAQQGTGDAKRSDEEVKRLQEADMGTADDSDDEAADEDEPADPEPAPVSGEALVFRTTVLGRCLPQGQEPQADPA